MSITNKIEILRFIIIAPIEITIISLFALFPHSFFFSFPSYLFSVV